jgi:hypothetical protein
VRDAAGYVEHLVQRDPERYLGDAGFCHRAGNLDQDGAGEGARIRLGEAGDAAGKNGWHRGEGLGAVDERRGAEQAAGRGEGRLLLGLAALALETLEQDRFLAQHVAALEWPHREADLDAATEHVSLRGSPRPRPRR